MLQNRGRMTSRDLAEELEVARRTILRDVDALTEAGLPIVVHRGQQGGIELGFDYRTRLFGLTLAEAEALGILLSHTPSALQTMGLSDVLRSAVDKLIDSLPDNARESLLDAQSKFRIVDEVRNEDPRVAALVQAVKNRNVVRLRYQSGSPQIVHPLSLSFEGGEWWLKDAQESGLRVARSEWGDINISSLTFGDQDRANVTS